MADSKFVFTCIDCDNRKQTFNGFRHAFHSTIAYPHVLAVVIVGGEVKLYFIDPENVAEAVSEIGRMYRTTHGEEPRIAVYNRAGIYDQYGNLESEVG
jgi:hypothetical protein